jgi:MFS family permease
VGKFAGIFAAIGLAVGALGTALASMVGGLFALKWWQIPIALVGLLLLVSGPAVIMAWFKLRSRNLGPILDANGWAINARARINIPFGTSLTQLAVLPANAERSLTDPYAEKKKPWVPYALVLGTGAAVVVLWKTGFIQL